MQIYDCIRQPSGGFAVGQFGVAAVLRAGILHSAESTNGAGNVPELLLEAAQFGTAPAF
jgi:hypothetical protein